MWTNKYCGHYAEKQFIRGKPIRHDFKNWAICSDDGFLYQAEPYCGKSTESPDFGLGCGPNVVLGLLEKVNVPCGSWIYFDNYISTVCLLHELSKKQLGGTD